ncbi:blue-light sensor BLUF [Skermanella stibiiresistens SB22]|uniref:Blue-light sensor BLUF n=1 Tax=Skermanella stibiiresistens SB22 TaxID=1385369 RepID=W9H219_9PROT|nr:BLUF domain-containing protein [Skermanella stibiiresistens]EWY37803.1 blue-light sensor BLUF [Skermanella stibiiresistens SB22]
MTTEIHRIVYFSRNAIPGSEETIAAEIRQILESSRRNNTKADVTGALMFNAGCFAQVLEGPQSAVTRTFERIQRDPRHGEVLVLDYGAKSERAFANWSMSFVGRDLREKDLFGAISSETGFDASRLSAEVIFTTLHRLVVEEEKSAVG